MFRKLFFILLQIYINFDFFSFWDYDPTLLATRTLFVKNEPVFSPFSSIFDGQFWNPNNFLSSRLLFRPIFFILREIHSNHVLYSFWDGDSILLATRLDFVENLWKSTFYLNNFLKFILSGGTLFSEQKSSFPRS